MSLKTQLNVRVSPSLKRKFITTAKKFGDPSKVHRTILEAFADGRFTIVPDPKTPMKENIYDN